MQNRYCTRRRAAHGRKEAETAGTLGGIVLALTIMVVNLSLFACKEPGQVPTVKMAEHIGSAVGGAFTVILILGIFSTAAPMLWTVCEQLKDREKTGKHLLLGGFICADALVLGQLPFDRLVGAVYPAAGWIGILLLIFLARIKIK